jgi:hypothetical protein
MLWRAKLRQPTVRRFVAVVNAGSPSALLPPGQEGGSGSGVFGALASRHVVGDQQLAGPAAFVLDEQGD